MRASDMDFSTVRHFKEREFPQISTSAGSRSVLEFTDESVVRVLDTLRDQLGHALIPSPVTGGWVREGGSTGSRHYIGPIRQGSDGQLESAHLSTAGDFFPKCDVRKAFLAALAIPEIGGIGVYLDTRGPDGTRWNMMHIDLREGPRQVWMRVNGRYIYPYRGQAEMDEFFRLLGEV